MSMPLPQEHDAGTESNDRARLARQRRRHRLSFLGDVLEREKERLSSSKPKPADASVKRQRPISKPMSPGFPTIKNRLPAVLTSQGVGLDQHDEDSLDRRSDVLSLPSPADSDITEGQAGQSAAALPGTTPILERLPSIYDSGVNGAPRRGRSLREPAGPGGLYKKTFLSKFMKASSGPKHAKAASVSDTFVSESRRIQEPSQSTQPAWPEERSPLRPNIGSIAPTVPPRSSSGSIPIFVGDGTFRYRKLQGTEFRLIRLLPQSMTSIKCEVIHASLQSPPHYVALSYAWGDVDDTTKIQLDGCPYLVTLSLHGALQRLRQPNKSVMLWIDALCIDQQNTEERSHQVQLMASIFSQADSVTVWLGPESDDSARAVKLLETITDLANSDNAIQSMISSEEWRSHFAALVTLFERDYWSRLWVVQEVLNASSISVYCGRSVLPWSTFAAASEIFESHKGHLDYNFPGGLSAISQQRLSCAQVLTTQGPASLHGLRFSRDLGARSLLEVLHACRRKLAAKPQDKVFGVLGILPEEIRWDFPPNYNASLREVYTNVVDFLLHTMRRLDVICEAIYFPIHTSTVNLPSWVPDWSHIPQTSSIGLTYDFSAGAATDAEFSFIDPPRRRKLEIGAIRLDTIKSRGIPVGTLCGLDDSLMAFLHWRAKLLGEFDLSDPDYAEEIHKAFCRTLCFDQVSTTSKGAKGWTEICYHVFASLIRERLPHLPLDRDLQQCADANVGVAPEDRRGILLDKCASCMMSRCFFLTHDGLMGLGTGFMDPDDVVCVPLGCNTPILLRQEGSSGEYRYVGDVYVDGYMHGKAVEQWRSSDGERQVSKYVLH
ncbi:heterokaryon incompatibility protein-domain-containing protein [Xylariales sp. AK1849]|nr:heterokaryon incompatibility protein-domain-containing protein [Xylariales sp. AK1849]